jgi:formylglycine-generating enzyme required for sulfatase activity
MCWLLVWLSGRGSPFVAAIPLAAAAFLSGAPASAVTIDWTPIGDAGNACDSQSQGCFGAVGHAYRIATFEVTNAQYAEFLNAVADTDSTGLYNPSMASGSGGITRSGSAGSYVYTTIGGRENRPVGDVSLYDSLRFANWLHNGQPDIGAQTGASTEDGAYTFTGAQSVGARNPGATIFLPSEDEWYKAAYYDAFTTSYFEFPTGTDSLPSCSAPTASPNSANCGFEVNDFTDVGSYTGSASPYGTFDQGGNAFERNETLIEAALGSVRGGGFNNTVSFLRASNQDSTSPAGESDSVGFRVAMVPEPGTGLLLTAGLLALSRRGRRRWPITPAAGSRAAASGTRPR